jgi:3-hydroxyacyl-CoA dehydrogenase
MGGGIAAHLANAGIQVYLLDIAPAELTPDEERRGLKLESPQVRNRIVARIIRAHEEVDAARILHSSDGRPGDHR